MPTYKISYGFWGYGDLIMSAANKDELRDLFYEIPYEDLVLQASCVEGFDMEDVLELNPSNLKTTDT